jgi:hypothetical protein
MSLLVHWNKIWLFRPLGDCSTIPIDVQDELIKAIKTISVDEYFKIRPFSYKVK